MPLAPAITEVNQLKDHPALARLLAWNAAAIEGAKFDREELSIYVERGSIREACALLRDAGRTITSGLYFVAGLAIVYGLLSMFSLPLQQAIGGTCPVPPQPCAPGLQRPLTVAENTGMGFGAGFAIASLLVGFFGLLVFYRRTVQPASAPPERKIPAIAPPPSAVQPVAVTPTPNSSAAENGSAPEDEPELPAHQEDERPELPPHESTPPTT